ncbi:DNA-directed RNA polymerase subunit beta [Bienertia sinuspersici]
MARTPIVRQKVATNPSSKAKTAKRSTSKHNSSYSKSKKMVPASAKDKRKEVDINYYDIDFNGDAKFKEKYEMLFRRGVVATKYCDIDALKTLRIEEYVRWLFDNIGLGNLLTIKTPTSMRATLEFLSSLKVHMFPNPSGGESSITFWLFNEDHTWTLEKFNEALGIPIGGPRVTPQHWNEKELWRTISVELDYDLKRSFVTSIRHPALRYVFKVFSDTIFDRQEGSKVRKDEIFMLRHMLHATPIDTGAFLIHQLQSTANNVNTGGFITRIATYLGHREQLIRDGFVDGTDAVERNWSFNYSSTSVHVPLLPEPSMSTPSPPYDGDPSSPSPTISSCASMLNFIDETMANQKVIMADQKEIKDELASISAILTSLGPWLKSQGFPHPSLPPP